MPTAEGEFPTVRGGIVKGFRTRCGSRDEGCRWIPTPEQTDALGCRTAANQASCSHGLPDAPAEGKSWEPGSKPATSPPGDLVAKPPSGGGSATSSSDGRAGRGTSNLGPVRDGLFGGLRCREHHSSWMVERTRLYLHRPCALAAFAGRGSGTDGLVWTETWDRSQTPSGGRGSLPNRRLRPTGGSFGYQWVMGPSG
jgi:hypothetical protein